MKLTLKNLRTGISIIGTSEVHLQTQKYMWNTQLSEQEYLTNTVVLWRKTRGGEGEAQRWLVGMDLPEAEVQSPH